MKKESKFDEELVESEEDVQVDNMKNGEFTIMIDGEIGWDVTADSVNEQLEKANGCDVVFEVASPGGSVFEGVSIFNAIRNYEGKTEARIIGLAASMASYIPLATDKVLAEDNATLMIHNPWNMAVGDAEELRDQADVLQGLTEMMSKAYMDKTGKSQKEVLQMMADETWMMGDEMKKEGFVDEMIVHDKSDPDKKKKSEKASAESKASALAEAKTRVTATMNKVKEEKMKSDFEQFKSAFSMPKTLKMSKFNKWSDKYKKSLPDSAFAVVRGEGKDKVRKLAFKDADDKVDVPHLRNSMVRIAQGKVDMSEEDLTTAMTVLKGVASEYLDARGNTASAKVMTEAMSKFEVKPVETIDAIIAQLKGMARNKKPSDEIYIEVKKLSLLIDDLESTKEAITTNVDAAAEETPPDKKDDLPVDDKIPADTTPIDKKDDAADNPTDTKDPEDNADPKDDPADKKPSDDDAAADPTGDADPKNPDDAKDPEEDKDGKKDDATDEEEEESKFKEAIDLCESYQAELEKKDQLVSKFEKLNADLVDKHAKHATALETEITGLKSELSKFEEDKYNGLLNATVDKVSKFKKLDEAGKSLLRKHYMVSKLSETALEEIGRTTDDQMFSKLGEAKPTTKPSDQLEPAQKAEEDFSKLSKDDQLEVLARVQAKKGGFVD